MQCRWYSPEHIYIYNRKNLSFQVFTLRAFLVTEEAFNNFQFSLNKLVILYYLIWQSLKWFYSQATVKSPSSPFLSWNDPDFWKFLFIWSWKVGSTGRKGSLDALKIDNSLILDVGSSLVVHCGSYSGTYLNETPCYTIFQSISSENK